MRKLKAFSFMSIASLSILSACNTPSDERSASRDNDSGEASNSAELEEENTSLTEEEVLQETVKQLDTNIPIWAPASLDLSEEHHLTATTNSTNTSYEVELFSLDEPTSINNEALSDEDPFFLFSSSTFENQEAAIDHIQSELDGYLTFESETEKVDLGYDITGQVQAGTGHSGVAWNEGIWELRSIASGDQIKEAEPLAKEVVDLLEEITLPAPDELGTVFINQDQEEGTLTELYWQKDSQVFKAQSTSLAPEDVLKIVSTMEEWRS
ncbi:hypothetical protein NSQ54_05125 [Alkalihalobacillus sp. FSL W8-0930]